MPHSINELRKTVTQAGGHLQVVSLKLVPGDNGGCGVPTHVAGTNGGTLPCGSWFTAGGITKSYYCGHCSLQMAGKKLSTRVKTAMFLGIGVILTPAVCRELGLEAGEWFPEDMLCEIAKEHGAILGLATADSHARLVSPLRDKALKVEGQPDMCNPPAAQILETLLRSYCAGCTPESDCSDCRVDRLKIGLMKG